MSFGRPAVNPLKILWGMLLILMGIGTFYLSLHQANQSIHNGFKRFIIPGTFTVEVQEPGTYTIYHEFRSNFRGKSYLTPALPQMKVSAENKINHEPVKLSRVENPTEYEMGESQGRELYTFEVEKPMAVKVDVEWADGSEEPVTVFSVAGNFSQKMTEAFTRGILFLILFIVAGLGVIILHVGQVNALNREFQEIMDSTPPPPVFSRQAEDPVERLTDEEES